MWLRVWFTVVPPTMNASHRQIWFESRTFNFCCLCDESEKTPFAFYKRWKKKSQNCFLSSTLSQRLSLRLRHTMLFHLNLPDVTLYQGCGVARSRRFLGVVGVGFPTTLGVGVGIFVRLRLRMSIWIIFYITLLNWESLLKWYNLFWNCCWNRDFLLCTTISTDFNKEISFPLC